MKKLLYIFAAVVMVFTTACDKEDSIMHEGEGSITFAVNTGTRAGSSELLEAIKDKLTFRIYSVANKGTADEAETLVRLYTYAEIMGDGSSPMQIWLLAGDYRVKVEGGEKSEASFDDIYYMGTTDFVVAEGTQSEVRVTCRPSNAMVKVVFEQSVTVNMGVTAAVVVAIDDEYDGTAISQNMVPNLTYTSTDVGYFTPKEGDTKFVWKFTGTVAAKDNKQVEKLGTYTPDGGFQPGYMYTLTFKYSPDLGGYLTMNIEVDKEPEVFNNSAIFKPEPQLSDVENYPAVVNKTAQVYNGMTLAYNVKAISNLTEVELQVNGAKLTYTSSQMTQDITRATYKGFVDEANGVEIAVIDSKQWQVLLKPNFIEKLNAGANEYVIVARDDTEAEAEYVQDYIGEGMSSIAITDGKEWEGEATVTATIYNPTVADLYLHYKESAESEYKSVAMSAISNNQATATVSGLRGGRIYDGYLTYTSGGSAITSGTASFSTPNGKQIPNGGMEEWSGDSPLLPYISTQWWDSGNHGSATLKKNVTTSSTDVRPGTTGRYSAKLQSQFVSFLGIGKFAAGNIFFGTYLGTSGTNGTIGFGKPFTFDYKPDKLTVWYKGNIGTADYGGGGLSKGNSDKAQIYVWLYYSESKAQCVVNTADDSTFLNPDGTYVKTGGAIPGLVAYGYWNRTQSQTQVNGAVSTSYSYDGWTKLEIPLVYKDGVTQKPNMLVISCAASAYGDYFAGSTDSNMYVDDFEFVY